MSHRFFDTGHDEKREPKKVERKRGAEMTWTAHIPQTNASRKGEQTEPHKNGERDSPPRGTQASKGAPVSI